jgi:predicted RNase H-like HicB family nuclease
MSIAERIPAFEYTEVTAESWDWPKQRYECKVLLCPEEDGGYSAHALNIAGVVSEGDTVPAALANIADAFKASIEYYLESKLPIPWGEEDRTPFVGVADTFERWIAVDV